MNKFWSYQTEAEQLKERLGSAKAETQLLAYQVVHFAKKGDQEKSNKYAMQLETIKKVIPHLEHLICGYETGHQWIELPTDPVTEECERCNVIKTELSNTIEHQSVLGRDYFKVLPVVKK